MKKFLKELLGVVILAFIPLSFLTIMLTLGTQANSQQLNTGVTVYVSVEKYTEPFVQVGIMEETQNGEAWTGYKEWRTGTRTGSVKDYVTQFLNVPYGSFSVFANIDACGGKRIAQFTVGEGVRKVHIEYDAVNCNFSFGVFTR